MGVIVSGVKRIPAAIFLMLYLSYLLPVARAGGSDLEKRLNWQFEHKVLTLRRFYGGDHLRFLSDGKLEGDAAIGPWTLDGQIEVNDIHVKHDVVEIKGRRVHIVFDSKSRTNQVPTPLDQMQAASSLSRKELEDLEKDLGKLKATVEIELPSNATEADISSAIHAVFLMPGESMIDAVPEYWRKYFAKLEGKPASAPVSTFKTYTVSGTPGPGRVSPPKMTYDPEPEYSDWGRKAKYQGTVVFNLVVGEDGTPHDIQVAFPLGIGLDEKAVSAISEWKFEPATKDGQPVPVAISVEVTFRLY
jgi:protein TonB